MIKIVNNTFLFPSLTSGAITIPATTAGNVLVVMAISFGGGGSKWVAPNFLSSSDGQFTQVPFYSLQGGVVWDFGSIVGSGTSADILYQVTTGGITSVLWDSSVETDAFYIWEVSGLITPVSIDDFKLTGSGTVINVIGSALAGGHNNDLCIENVAVATSNLKGALAPWAIDYNFQLSGSGPAFQLGVSGTQSATNFTTLSIPYADTYTCVSVAFVGSGSPPVAPNINYAFTDNLNLLIRYVDTNNNIHTLGPLYSGDEFFDYSAARLQPGGGGGIDGPWGISQFNGLVYVVDEANEVVWQINPANGFTQRIVGGGKGSLALSWSFSDIYEILFDPQGNLFVADVGNKEVVCVNRQAMSQTFYGVTIASGAAAAVIGSPFGYHSDTGMAIDSAGNFYTTDQGNTGGLGNVVRKVTPAGVVSIFAGVVGVHTNTGDGGPASAATLDSPFQLSIDHNGVLFIIANGLNGGSLDVIRAVNTAATIQTVNGVTILPGNIETIYTFPNPSNVWYTLPDNLGNLYVCDVVGHGLSEKGWLHTLDSTGSYSVVAGSPVGTLGYSGDGGAATAALIGVTFAVTMLPAATPPPPPNFPAPPGGDRFKLTPSPTSGPVQNIPLDNAPNQTWSISVNVDGNPIPLKLVLRYNEIAAYWVATIFDGQGNLLLDSIPLITGDGISQNLLAQFPYLEIGSATIFNASQQA